MDKIQVLHDYNRLVRRELVPPLLCSRDEFDLVVRMEGTEPLLKCYSCGAITSIGEKMWEELEATVKEKLK